VSDLGIGERDRLQHFLDQQRGAVVAIIDGLDESQLHTRVFASGWSPIGLLRHLVGAEAMWFQWVVRGAQPQVTWDDDVVDPPYDPEAPFVTGHSSTAVIAQYRRQCEISDEVLRASDLDAPLVGEHGLDWPGEPITDVRWVVLHMIEETARHAGHLDVARELLDGATGRGPRLAGHLALQQPAGPSTPQIFRRRAPPELSSTLGDRHRLGHHRAAVPAVRHRQRDGVGAARGVRVSR
jgi:hypothetical protein